MASLADLPGTANAILAAFADALEEGGLTVPERRYVHSGTGAAWDGPQLTVGIIDVKQGQPGGAIATTQSPRAVNFFGEWRVVLLRATDTLGDGPRMLPSDDAIDESGEQAMEDVGALIKAFSTVHVNNAITSSGEGMVLQACRPLAEAGGMVGTELLLDLSLR